MRDVKRIHFVGIGGIGVSALARYYLSHGCEISGTDIAESEITEGLGSEGVDVSIGHHPSKITKEIDQVIYSVAVPKDDPELKRAGELNIPINTYAEAIAELMERHFTIAVSGSHGKGSTTALLSLMLIEAGLDPTVIIGTRLKEFGGSNFRAGKSKYFIVEADEYDRSFWNYRPDIAIVTNVDNDHLDVFKNLDGVIEAFRRYLENLPRDAIAILNKEDTSTPRLIEDFKCEIRYFGRSERQWGLQVPGEFSQLNAEAAWQAAKIVSVTRETAESAVKKYHGAWRRMEELEPIKNYENAVFFADYGHHPTEIKVTTKAFKEKFPKRKLLLIYQPHQGRRLEELFEDFTICFKEVDELVLLPVYEVAGREGKIKKTSEDLAGAVKEYNQKSNTHQKISYLKTLEDALKLIGEQLVVFMGAGDIDVGVRKYFRSKLLPG